MVKGVDPHQKTAELLKKTQLQTWEEIRRYLPEITEIALNQHTKADFFKESTHGPFLQPVHKMASKIGIKNKPAVFLVENIPGIPAAYRKLPNAGGNPILNAIMINPKILEMTKSSQYQAPSEGMKAILAHELSHIRYDLKSFLGTQFGPMIAPAAGIAGLWLYDRAQKKRKSNNDPTSKEDITQLNQDIHDLAEEEKERIDQEEHEPNKWHMDPGWQKAAVNVGRYMAVAAASYAGAMLLARYASLSREYRADRVAIELTGNPEAYKQALIDLHKTSGEMKKGVSKATTFKEWFTRTYSGLESMTNHAHPKLKPRLNAIDSHAEKLGLTRSATENITR